MLALHTHDMRYKLDEAGYTFEEVSDRMMGIYTPERELLHVFYFSDYREAIQIAFYHLENCHVE